MLDIFNEDAFSVLSLTDAINNLEFIPGRIGQLGLFQETGITTTMAAIEQKDGTLTLIAPTPRGGPGHTLPKGPRSLRAVVVPHFEINDAVMAEEVQGVRAFGSETLVETVMGKVGERLQQHSQSMEVTQEYSRIGAIRGEVVYADGSTLDLYETFGVEPNDVINLELDSASTDGSLRQSLSNLTRIIANKLGGTPFRGFHAFVGDEFFDALVKNPEVRETYLGWAAAAELRQGYIDGTGQSKIFGAFEFGGITWENYRGQVGDVPFIQTDRAHIIPLGVPGLFRTYYAPADYIETVNTVGQRNYSKQYEMSNGKGIHLDTQMNALDICTRPGVLLEASIAGTA